MKKDKNRRAEVAQLESELRRTRRKIRRGDRMNAIFYTLIVLIAVVILVTVFLVPVVRISGNSMEPFLNEGDVVITLKTKEFRAGDILNINFGSKTLVKRCIAFENQIVDIDEEGNVYIDEKKLNEPYIREKALGQCELELPYTVPEDCVFILGDKRATSIDSRSISVGCVEEGWIVGRISFRIWPLRSFGKVDYYNAD